jgi:hypothetical protein
MSLSNNYPNAIPSLSLDFAGTKKLDPRITFTRASTGTYYNGVTTAKAEENLFTNSQDINSWTLSAVTAGTNTDTAPDGTTTAEAIKEDSTTGTHRVQQPNGMPLLNATTYTMSVFVKQKTGSRFATIGFSADGGNFTSATFNLATGASTQNLTFGFTSASATITPSVNNWYRVTLTATTNVASAAALMFLGLSATSTFTSVSRGFDSYAGDNTSEILYWGAQLEQRSAVSSYTPTTTQPITNYIPVLLTAQNNIPRFEHNPVTGESLGLEIEEQRTNLMLRSEEFENASWTKIGSSITQNTIIAPDGTLTGDKLFENTATGEHLCRQFVTGLVANTNYTTSFFAKPAERQNCRIRILDTDNTANGYTVVFNLVTGATSASQSIGSGVFASASATSVGNGWYRITLTGNAGASCTKYTTDFFLETTSNNYAGNGYSGIYIWGAQLEAGAFPTSYIPTVASQVTRSADSASMTGTNFSSWFNNSEGTLYADASTIATGTIQRRVVSINDATTNNMINISRVDSSGQSRAEVVVNGTTVSNSLTTAWASNSSVKVINSYKVDDFAAVLNAGTVATDTSGTIPVVNQLVIGDINGNNKWVGTIKKISYYPARLTNQQIVALTTV